MSIEKRKYVGARYVPLFSTPLEWSNTRTYEPLTIVEHQGNSYTSRQFVPVGIDISNEDYWALSANYNAQMEQYRQEVQAFDGRITKNADDIAAINVKLSEKPIMLVIGDSFTQQGTWVQTLANKLGMTVSNYGISGSAFHNWGTGISFIEQLTKAKNEVDVNKLGLIVFVGGINDMASTEAKADFLTNVTAFCNYYNNNFPNVKFLGQVGYLTPKYLANDTVTLCKGAESRFMLNGLGVLKGSWMIFNMLRTNYISDDGVHPTNAGYTVILSRFLNAINGTEDVSVSMAITGGSGVTISNPYVQVSTTNITVRATVTVNTAATRLLLGSIPLFTNNAPFVNMAVSSTNAVFPLLVAQDTTNTKFTISSASEIASGTILNVSFSMGLQ